jgi:diguanylate cyclase (GGDEF)-like protein/PAS domain S-box-containing protein
MSDRKVVRRHDHPFDAGEMTEDSRAPRLSRNSVDASVRPALEHVHRVLEHFPQYIFWKDRDSVYLGCNEHFARVAGVETAAEIVGKTDFDLAWTREEAEFFREVDRRVMGTNTPEYHIIEPQLQADGRRAWLDTSKVPLRDDHGRVAGILGVYEDITERVESEAVLKRSNLILEAVSFAARTLLEQPDWTGCIDAVLENLGVAAEVNRVHIVKLEESDGDSLATLKFEWSHEIEQRLGKTEVQNVPLAARGLGRWLAKLQAGDVIHGRVTDFPESERAFLRMLDIKSTAVVPIFVEKELLGFLGFDDCTTERKWLTAEIEALRAAAGSLGAAIHRKRVEDALRLETKQFEQLFRNAPLAVLMADSDDKVLQVNPAFEILFGYSNDEVKGQRINELITPSDREREATDLTKRTLAGEAVQVESVRTHRSGRDVFVQVIGVPVTAGGELRTVYGIYVDQTQRRQAEQALRESEERFRSLAEQSLQGIFLLADERFVFVNRIICEVTGYSQEELLGMDRSGLETLIHPSDRGLMLAALRGHQAAGGERISPSTEFRAVTKTGEERWILLQTRVIQLQGDPAVEGVMIDITQRKRAERQLLHSALHDSLTGLPNRALFHDRVVMALDRSRGRDGNLFAVLVFDLDRFKVVNDSLSHAAGDRLLVELSRRLKDVIRPGDTVARLGGDEFSVLVNKIKDRSDAEVVASRIHEVVEAPFAIGGNEVFTTVSTGIAISNVRYSSPEEVVRDADIAMYRAKSLGRSCHQVFDPEMHTHAKHRLQLETEFRHALERDEFELHFQPIVDLPSSRPVAFEALIRWRHPERGLLMPGEFLEIADETSLILPMGEWVLRAACREAQTWPSLSPDSHPPGVSVNLVSRQFSKPELVEFIKEVLGSTGLDADRLNLEITESTVIDAPERAIDVLLRLQNLGVKVHVDDFGTGYSSLAYLQRFAVDALKIDQSFTARIDSAGGEKIVKAIITLAHGLGMAALAEGVETPKQFDRLCELGCDFGQGFLFARPMEASKISAYMKGTTSSTT